MIVQDLIDHSPIRVFEDSINGGLGRGNLGVLTSRPGVGKTACLVHLAVDQMLRGENVVHVSFGTNVEHIMNWYREVFREITEFKSIKDADTALEYVKTNRVMMNFSQENVSVDKIISSLETLIGAGAFKADAVYFDGYKLTMAAEDDVKKLKAFAKEMNVEVWFSVSPVRPDAVIDEHGVANTLLPYVDLIDVLVGLNYNDDKSSVIMTVVKAKDIKNPTRAGVSLNPKTMLIA